MPRPTTHATSEFLHCRAESALMGEDRDCSVKAVALVTNTPYRTAHAVLAQLGRKPRCGVPRHLTGQAVRELGFKLTTLVPGEYVAKLERDHNYRVKNLTTRQLVMFPDLLGPGTFLVGVSGHVLCVKDGQVHDWSGARALRVREITRVEEA